MENQKEYYEKVDSLVHHILTEKGNYPERPLSDIVFENIDSSELMIYNKYHLEILNYSRKEPEEWKHLVGENENYRDVIQAMAYDVLRIDVWEEINERDIDY